ncbi:hypothetical protein AOA61_11820 [Pseudomonas sp. 2995-1]|nr:hypothetical protein AOA61_11820 [Pseudomonas sp. 2995-1]
MGPLRSPARGKPAHYKEHAHARTAAFRPGFGNRSKPGESSSAASTPRPSVSLLLRWVCF